MQRLTHLTKEILIDGPVVSLNSASLIDRQLAFHLSQLGHEVHITAGKGNRASRRPDGSRIIGNVLDLIDNTSDVDITIRNGWPPELSQPPQGHWVVIQPWEFGSLPKKWAEVFSRDVDEMWVPSRYVRDVYVASGVPPDRVYVVPNGVDPAVFNPDAPPYPLKTKKSFRFLFVGGAIPRKGIDFLLNAYSSTFTPADDVCLVIKDFGADSFYKGMTLRDQILDLTKRSWAPEIEYIDADLMESELAGLYVASDLLVNPYRGEGFGMPILEAMACDTPAMVTNGGAALDFCNEKNSVLINASEKILSKKEVFGLETVDCPRVFNVDMQDFKSKLRWAANNKKQLENIGRQAGPLIRASWTWNRSAEIADRRIRSMAPRMRTGKEQRGIHSDFRSPSP